MANINFEQDTRHDVTDRMLQNYKKVSYKQDDFGIKKYNTPLHHSLPYSWDEMIDEELVDLMKYRQCEKDRKAHIIQLLEAAMRVDDPKQYIKTALELLTMSGTGK